MVVVAGRPQIRYEEPRIEHVRMLKAVRTVSCLHATHGLLVLGHTVEAAALLRDCDDLLEEIVFLHVEEDGPTGRQAQFVEHYLSEEERPVEERQTQNVRRASVGRRHIRAHVGRYLGGDDPSTAIAQSRVVDDAFSGAVRGDYPSTMDLYGGPTESEARFHMRGMRSTPKMPPYVSHLALYAHRALNVLSLLAIDLGMEDLFSELQEARGAFEQSDAYPA